MIRSNIWLSRLAYSSLVLFGLSTSIEFALIAYEIDFSLIVLIYVALPGAAYQNFQTTMRLISPLCRMLMHAFDCWYIAYQIVAAIAALNYFLVALKQHWMVVPLLMFGWTTLNMVTNDAMCEISRLRVVSQFEYSACYIVFPFLYIFLHVGNRSCWISERR